MTHPSRRQPLLRARDLDAASPHKQPATQPHGMLDRQNAQRICSLNNPMHLCLNPYAFILSLTQNVLAIQLRKSKKSNETAYISSTISIKTDLASILLSNTCNEVNLEEQTTLYHHT